LLVRAEVVVHVRLRAALGWVDDAREERAVGAPVLHPYGMVDHEDGR